MKKQRGIVDFLNQSVDGIEIYSELACYRYMVEAFDTITRITTGIQHPEIEICCNNYNFFKWEDNDKYYLHYNIGDRNNNIALSKKTYKLCSNIEDCEYEMKKIIDIFHNITTDKLIKWIQICKAFKSNKLIGNLNNTDYGVSHIFKDKYANDKEKINKLLELHNNLLSSNDSVMQILDYIQPYWEIKNFTVRENNSGDQTLYGKFNNYDIPNIEFKRKPCIVFPENSRGSLCTNFIALSNFKELQGKNIGEIIKLKYNRKSSKPKEYKIVRISIDDFYAVEELKTGKIEFIADEYDIKNCYSALYTCNKAIYNSWYRKKYTLVK